VMAVIGKSKALPRIDADRQNNIDKMTMAEIRQAKFVSRRIACEGQSAHPLRPFRVS